MLFLPLLGAFFVCEYVRLLFISLWKIWILTDDIFYTIILRKRTGEEKKRPATTTGAYISSQWPLQSFFLFRFVFEFFISLGALSVRFWLWVQMIEIYMQYIDSYVIHMTGRTERITHNTHNWMGQQTSWLLQRTKRIQIFGVLLTTYSFCAFAAVKRIWEKKDRSEYKSV